MIVSSPGRSIVVAAIAATATFVGSGAVRADTDPALRTSVNTAVRGALRVAPSTSVHLVDVASGETVYSYRDEVPRILASNTKLFTTAAALELLGPGYFFETKVLSRGHVEGRVLYGDLAVIGGGDPLFSGREHGEDVYGVFRSWARELWARGVRRVQGGLVLVHGLFDDERVHPDWPRDQLDRWYEAPVDALSFSDNCLLVRVRPSRTGAPVRVETTPALDLFRIESTATTQSRAGGAWIDVTRVVGEDPWTVRVRGRLYRRGEHAECVTVPDPVAFFGSALRAAFLEEGIVIAGPTLAVESLRDAGEGVWREELVHHSDLLSVLEVINKRSQNFFAESVVKLLGSVLCGEGTWSGGVRAVEETLRSLELDPAEWSLADGSGMSRRNRATARALTELLVRMFSHRWATEYVATLPWSGEPGLSWERRLSDPPYRGNVLAKTGTLRAVSTLSGYAKGSSGRLYAFSILMNDASAVWKAKKAQDAFLRAVIDHG